MILQRQRSGTIAIKQEDHAAMAGFFLEHWTDYGFQHNPGRERIILATKAHDCGWHKFDSAPRIDSRTHLPVDFMHTTADEARQIWKSAIQAFLGSDPLIALLIIQHAYTINEAGHRRDSSWKGFFTELAQQRAELRIQLELTQNDLEQSYSFLRMMDWFSLAYCTQPTLGAEKPEKYGGYSIKRDGEQYLFRPYPFDSKDLHYQLPVYPMQKGGYPDEKELKKALKKPEYREVILNPLERF
jgi:hypothetical protein